MARKRRATETFGISFLDCICCGFGAIILLFVLTSGKKSDYREMELSTIDVDLGALSRDIAEEENATADTLLQLKALEDKGEALAEVEDKLKQKQLDKTRELVLMLERLSELEKSKLTLLGELAAIPKTEEVVPVPVPNLVRRQYLTDFKRDGENVAILVEASGGMLDETAEAAIAWIGQPEGTRRRAPKWSRAVRATEWLIAGLRPPTQFQVILFNRDATFALPLTANKWIQLTDKPSVAGLLSALKSVTPDGGANHERAFWLASQLKPPPDNIILITDGLPTLSDSVQVASTVDPATREKMFHAARRQIPIAVPVNTILFPMSGDPSASSLYWLLACRTDGSFICPAVGWPSL